MKLPNKIFGIDTKEAYKNFLDGISKSKEQETKTQEQPQAQNLEGFIYVPSIELYVAKERSHHNLDWYNTHKTIIPQGLRMPTPRETWELIFYLQDNLDNPELKQVYDDILKKTQTNDQHGEWQNAIFTQDKKGRYIQRVTGIDNRGLVLSQKERLEDHLEKDCLADITRSSINSQGLCTLESALDSYHQGRNIYFSHPTAGAVARFIADSVRVYLICLGDPLDSDSDLGVRLVAQPHKK